MHDRYFAVKLVAKMTASGYGANVVKHFAARLRSPGIASGVFQNPTSLHPKAIDIWHIDGDSSLKVGIANAFDGMSDVVKTKVMKLTESLGTHTKWSGAMTSIGENLQVESSVYRTPVELADTACSQPWVIAMKSGAWRHGPHAWPWPGTPFVSALTDQIKIITVVHAFMETPSGDRDMNESVKMTLPPKGALMFIPAGWMGFRCPQIGSLRT